MKSVILFFFLLVQVNLLSAMEESRITLIKKSPHNAEEFKCCGFTCLSRCSDQNLWKLACFLCGVSVGGIAAITSYVFYSHYVQGEQW